MLVIAVAGLFALSPRNTQRVQSAFLGFIAPFLKTGSTMQTKFIAIREGLKTLPQLEQENTQLAVENKELKATNQMLRDLAVENNKLRRALEYRERSLFKLVPARIIARDATTWWNTVKIDKGAAEGVEPDMPVLTEDGLVGKTTVVAEHASTILLIADENCKVAANVEGSREQGIVKGERTSTTAIPDLGLNFLSKTADLKPTQKVYSSGVGGVYPSGVLIGVVKKFEVRSLDGHATLVPAVDLTTLEDVFVVTGRK
ncbi:MAG: rod shape-determining protein MreC [Chthoniobacter sp.]|nr:rod shape-determining protein MreC [Chthoniobacter sp.]